MQGYRRETAGDWRRRHNCGVIAALQESLRCKNIEMTQGLCSITRDQLMCIHVSSHVHEMMLLLVKHREQGSSGQSPEH